MGNGLLGRLSLLCSVLFSGFFVVESADGEMPRALRYYKREEVTSDDPSRGATSFRDTYLHVIVGISI